MVAALDAIGKLSESVDGGPGRFLPMVERGHAGRLVIERERSLGADLIVIAKRARSSVEALLLGSVTRHILADAGCDVLVLLDVYPAGEAAIPGADSRSLTRSIRQRGQVEPIFAERIEDVPELLRTIILDGDVIVTQGAGNVSRLAQDLSAQSVQQGTLL